MTELSATLVMRHWTAFQQVTSRTNGAYKFIDFDHQRRCRVSRFITRDLPGDVTHRSEQHLNYQPDREVRVIRSKSTVMSRMADLMYVGLPFYRACNVSIAVWGGYRQLLRSVYHDDILWIAPAVEVSWGLLTVPREYTIDVYFDREPWINRERRLGGIPGDA